MSSDPLVEEVRRIKEQLAAEYDYDVRAIGKALQQEQERSGRRLVRLSPRKDPQAG